MKSCWSKKGMGFAERTVWSKAIENDLRIGEPMQFMKKS